jgi:hypothetical protein
MRAWANSARTCSRVFGPWFDATGIAFPSTGCTDCALASVDTPRAATVMTIINLFTFITALQKGHLLTVDLPTCPPVQGTLEYRRFIGYFAQLPATVTGRQKDEWRVITRHLKGARAPTPAR